MDQAPNKTITLLTANQRLAAFLRQQYDSLQQSLGLITWPSLDCLPLNRWIIRLFDTLTDSHLILSEAQELALWEKIITAALDNTDNAFILLRPFAVAQTARDAWHLLKQWRLPLSLLKDSPSEDIQHFYQWAQNFVAVCETEQWIDHSECTEILIKALTRKHLLLPQHLILSGFEEISPQISQLSKALSSHCQIHWHLPTESLWELINAIQKEKKIEVEVTVKKTELKRLALSDPHHELQAMALWARKELKQNPKLTVGCVVPELNTLRPKVERIFTEVFTNHAPEFSSDITQYSLNLSHDLAAPLSTLPFNISAGISFYKYPLIHTAIYILQLADAEVNIEQFSLLLRSPFIGGSEQEQIPRAILDIALRQPGERYLTLENVIALCTNHGQCSLWLQQLTAYLSVIQNPFLFSQAAPGTKNESSQSVVMSSYYLPSVWANYFVRLLTTMGWPGERSLNSAEFQQHQRWQTLLTEFTTLDLVVKKPISFITAVKQLQILAQQTLFQPQSMNAPVQVLGTLEASGIQFDRLWVMGMNDEYWPKPPNANPFIPIALQRKFNMPHSSAERELNFSKKLLDRFSVSAEQVIFSYSQRSEDTPLHMSALINPAQEISLLDLLDPVPPVSYDDRQLEPVHDEYAPSVGLADSIRGGASILKDQAACPFRAFARIRLGAAKLPPTTTGLSPIERGTFLHEILDQLWNVLDNHDTLCRYSEDKLTALIQETVSRVLIKKARRRPFSLKNRFIAVETQRLTQLISQWLQLEKQRPFFRVTGRETVRQINFAGLALQLRIDREDELADGCRVIVDYKTGQPRIDDWFGQRPSDPQLPLYCLTSEYPVAGIIFAQVRTAQLQFKGISAIETGIMGVKPIALLNNEHSSADWTTFQLQQREILEQLANDFLQGKAAVDPKNGEETCRNCELQMLCRIHEG